VTSFLARKNYVDLFYSLIYQYKNRGYDNTMKAVSQEKYENK